MVKRNLNEGVEELRDIIGAVIYILYLFGLSSILAFEFIKGLLGKTKSKVMIYKLLTFNIGLIKNKKYYKLYNQIKKDLYDEFSTKIDNQKLLSEVKNDLDNIIFLVDNVGLYLKSQGSDGMATTVLSKNNTLRVLFIKKTLQTEDQIENYIKHELRHFFGDIIGVMPAHMSDKNPTKKMYKDLIEKSFDLNQVRELKAFFKKNKDTNHNQITFGNEDVFAIVGVILEKIKDSQKAENYLDWFMRFIIQVSQKYEYLFSSSEMYPRLLSLYDDLKKYNNSKKIDLDAIISLTEKMDYNVISKRDYFPYLFFINYKDVKHINMLLNKLAIDYA